MDKIQKVGMARQSDTQILLCAYTEKTEEIFLSYF
jgi:hypothetical protein